MIIIHLTIVKDTLNYEIIKIMYFSTFEFFFFDFYYNKNFINFLI